MPDYTVQPILPRVPHDWQPPPAAQGTLEMCRKCGERRKPAIEAEPCMGFDVPTQDCVASEYDPFN